MQILANHEDLYHAFEDLLEHCDQFYFATAWATDKHDLFNLLQQVSHKIKLAVVGLHFYQTSPKFIEAFKDHQNFYFKKSVTGVFHPKFYIFEFEAYYKVIVGSANFTKGAFELNDEVSVLLEVTKNHEFVEDLFLLLDHYTEDYQYIDDLYLELYKEKYLLKIEVTKTIREIKTTTQIEKLNIAIPVDILINMTWLDFKKMVENDNYDGYQSRLELLDQVNVLLQKSTFSQLDKESRKFISGMKNNANFAIDYGWFGSLEGALLHKYVSI